jgi:DNA-binding transcriptional ArsR family regulator
MEMFLALKRLAALSQQSRLVVFRFLVKLGPEGMAAGDIANALSLLPSTLSAQLTILANAGLVTSRREGRSVIYTADYDAMRDLLAYLLEDCCGGQPDLCAPLVEVAAKPSRRC